VANRIDRYIHARKSMRRMMLLFVSRYSGFEVLRNECRSAGPEKGVSHGSVRRHKEIIAPDFSGDSYQLLG
jgi:hypothetical protein